MIARLPIDTATIKRSEIYVIYKAAHSYWHTDRQTDGRTDTGRVIVASAMKQIATISYENENKTNYEE